MLARPSDAVGEALAGGERVGQLVLVVPHAGPDQLVHVGAVGTVGIAEHPQRRLFHRAAIGRDEGERVLADVVLAGGLVGLGRQQRRFGQQLGLQRQQIAKDAGEGDHHVDPRPTELDQRQQLGAAEPPVTVEPRRRAHQPQRLGDRTALGLEVVGAPQHHRHRLRQPVALFHVLGEQAVGLTRPVSDGELAGDAERVEAVQIAPGRQHLGGAQQVAARRRPRIAAVERVNYRRQFVILGQLARRAGRARRAR